ncbi:WDR92 [Scenedesmus sp. PABB004]|nr:WDR92 [Scenedesmus sp. PABB004]
MIDAQDAPQILEHLQKSLTLTLYDTKWVPGAAKFVAVGQHARGTGALQVYALEGPEAVLARSLEGPAGFKCATFGASSISEPRLAVGTFAGRLQVWDVEAGKAPAWDAQAHASIAYGFGPPELVTCGRDGCVRVWDVRQHDAPTAAFEPADPTNVRDCWCVAFGNSFDDEERCVLAGYDNGDVKLFDLRMNRVNYNTRRAAATRGSAHVHGRRRRAAPRAAHASHARAPRAALPPRAAQLRWEANVKNGVCGVSFDRRDIPMNKFVVTCLESQMHVFDARTQHPHKGFASLTQVVTGGGGGAAAGGGAGAGGSTVWGAHHLPQNRDVAMVAAGDGSLSLWRYRYPDQRKVKDQDGKELGVVGSMQQLASRTLSSQPVNGFDWSPDKAGLFVCSAFDQCLRVGFVTRLNKL